MHQSPRPLRPPGPDAAEAELARRGRRGRLLQLYRIERGPQGLEQGDQIVVAVAEAFDEKLVLVDVDDDRPRALDAHAVGGVEALALGAQDFADDVRLVGAIAIDLARILAARVGGIGGLVVRLDAPAAVGERAGTIG